MPQECSSCVIYHQRSTAMPCVVSKNWIGRPKSCLCSTAARQLLHCKGDAPGKGYLHSEFVGMPTFHGRVSAEEERASFFKVLCLYRHHVTTDRYFGTGGILRQHLLHLLWAPYTNFEQMLLVRLLAFVLHQPKHDAKAIATMVYTILMDKGETGGTRVSC